MFRHEVNFTDFNGNEKKVTLYFNLTQSELLKMDAKEQGGLREKLQTIVDAVDYGAMMDAVDGIVDMAYGVKSPDGMRFEKNEKILSDFKSSPAYDKFFMELSTSSELATKFIKGILPQKQIQQILK